MLAELRRRLNEHLGSGGALATLVLAPGWQLEVVEGDEVFVRIEVATQGGGEG